MKTLRAGRLPRVPRKPRGNAETKTKPGHHPAQRGRSVPHFAHPQGRAARLPCKFPPQMVTFLRRDFMQLLACKKPQVGEGK